MCPAGDKTINELSSNVYEDFMHIRGGCPSVDHMGVVSGCNPRISLSLSVWVMYEKEG